MSYELNVLMANFVNKKQLKVIFNEHGISLGDKKIFIKTYENKRVYKLRDIKDFLGYD
tara:strand:- start:11920 stop:12093 length:174 start_codon:yes stop_codon:yes gene_type:complete